MNESLNEINEVTRDRSLYAGKKEQTVTLTVDEFNKLIRQNGWRRYSDVEVLDCDEGQVSGMSTVVSSHGGITVFYTESFQYTVGDELSFKTSIEGVNSPWMTVRAKVVDNIGDEAPLDLIKFPAIFSKVGYAATKAKIRHAVIDVNAFNKLRTSQKDRIFISELNRPGANQRTPPVYLGRNFVYFVFTGKTALICIESDDADVCFAVDAERAESCLNETISEYEDRADETGWQFDDWRQAHAYLAAAETLKDKVYQPKPRPFNEDYGY